MEDVLVEARMVGGGSEDRPDRLRRDVVAIMTVRVAVMVVGVTLRHRLLVEPDLLYRNVRPRSPRPRRNQLG